MSNRAPGKNQLRLLVVDPSEYERNLIRTLFTPQHEVLEAGTVEDGLDLVATEQPDVVIADHSWNTDGMKLCLHLRKSPELADTPFVLMSSFSRHIGEVRHFRAGCDQVLYKPFKGREIRAAIMTAMKRNHNQKQIHVVYRTGDFDFVTPQVLDDLIDNKQIVCFRRSSGIAIIDKDPIRSGRQGGYDGPERRQAAH